jgi:hypothetical protein
MLAEQYGVSPGSMVNLAKQWKYDPTLSDSF